MRSVRILKMAWDRPGYVSRRLLREASMEADRFFAPLAARRVTGEWLAHLAGVENIDALWNVLSGRGYPAVTNQADAARFRTDFPEQTAALIAAADKAVEHRIDLLGSGPVDLGRDIDWLQDFVTRDRWERGFCRSIDYLNKGRPSDVKRPWELSRLQWVLPVGQAYLLTGDEQYAQSAKDILLSWIEANPHAWTVNWSCTMEPALRIITWTWLFHVFSGSAAWEDVDFRGGFLSRLYLHGEFTLKHIERSSINGNHLTADAAGLVFAGLFFAGIGEGDFWADEGWRSLTSELKLQVHPDGVDFEASSAYHRFVAELFLVPARYRLARGLDIPQEYSVRLLAMGRFTAAYIAPDGDAPRWGDADDGRALPLGSQDINDHSYLPELIADTFGVLDPVAAGRSDGTECFWHIGRTQARPRKRQRHSQAFAHGGVYILADARNQVFIDCGPLGLKGLGGHGHNDALSFEAWLAGEKLIADPGSYVYTSDFSARNAFRATAAHNTPQVDGKEINRFLSPDNLWNLADDARPICLCFESGSESSQFSGIHRGYERLDDPVSVQRDILLDHQSGVLNVTDLLKGRGIHEVVVPLQFAPRVTLEPGNDGEVIAKTENTAFLISFVGSVGDWKITIGHGKVSPSYGIAELAPRLAARHKGVLPVELRMQIAPFTQREN